MSEAGDILASKLFISKIREFDVDKMDFVNYTLKGKNKDIEACALYAHYKKNSAIKNILFKKRFEIEKGQGQHNN